MQLSPQPPVLPKQIFLLVLSVMPQPVLPVVMAMSWLYVKHEFSDKPEEDPEVHLLRTID